MTFSNRLTPAQAERLALLIEECAEVQHVAAKALRHGLDSPHPVSRETNREGIQTEIGDLLASIHLLTWNGDLDPAEIKQAEEEKYSRLGQWLHHNKEGNIPTRSGLTDDGVKKK